MAAPKTGIKILDEKALRKKYSNAGKASIVIPSQDKTLWLPSRNLSLNYQLGGGIPYGRMMEVLGYESTGKSLMALDFASCCQALGGIVLWDDAEGTWANHWAKKNGVDPNQVELYQENDVEGFSDWMRDMIMFYRSKLVRNEPILLVLDSLAALECAENIDSDQAQSKAEMGNRAKAIYKFYRKRNTLLHKYGICMIAINQVREKVGASIYEDNTTSPGGAATKFYASQRVMLIRSKQIKVNDKKIGQNIIVRIEKNKIAPPAESIKTEVYFRDKKWGYTGYSRYQGLETILVDEGVLDRKKGASRFYRKDKMVANGEDALIKRLHEDEEFRSLMVRKSSINTISKTRKKMEAIEENLYPVKAAKGEDDGDEG